MTNEGPRYNRAAETAAAVVNLLAGDYPGGKAQLYGRVLYLILDAMNEAERELAEMRGIVSRN